ncbi:LytR/AlgR family response regulator transcription factor [Parvularcula maris]|uniref:LytTR family transcriptional regulator n=1 Tax=Parvularcula maris TaxID=2965077 RepID=A0A9X2L8P5_9PROT|nr:LytTR family DNA-binding domain-containing protein [Parvularcula maris]MCQ8185136.1 LytTR family transcriptional regulator [Parvularcula maris]
MIAMGGRDVLQKVRGHLSRVTEAVRGVNTWSKLGALTIAYVSGLYTVVFSLTRGYGPGEALGVAFQNVLPLALVSVMTWLLTTRWTVRRSLAIQAVTHTAGPIAFGLLWYLGIQIVRGLNAAVLTDGLEPRAFVLIVIAWQIVQGAFAYAAVVAAGYWRTEREHRRASESLSADVDRQATLVNRLLIRERGIIRTIGFEEIQLIRRAGDYSEIVTRTGQHLSNRSLAEMEAALPEDAFVRVHRSCIVNLNAVSGAEPAGNGRLTVFLSNGEMIETSRSGRTALLARAA